MSKLDRTTEVVDRLAWNERRPAPPGVPPLYWLKEPVAGLGLETEGYQLLNEAVLWGNAAWGLGEAEQSRQRRMLPRPLLQWMPALLDWGYMKRAGPKIGLPPLASPFGGLQISRAAWIQQILRACRTHGIPLPEVEEALRHPASTLRAAYRFARLAAARLGQHSPEFGLALATLRSAGGPLLKRRRCELCFRVAFPGISRCRVHTRSKIASTSNSSQVARTARLILQQEPDLRRDVSRLFGHTSRPDVLAGAMFPFPVADAVTWRLDVLDALNHSPRVAAKLARPVDDLTPVDLLGEIRLAIDPDQFNAHIWLDRIDLAERWLEAEERYAPGSPPKGPRTETEMRIQQIEDLLISGLTVKDVAKKLELSPSNVYQIVHRHGLTLGVKGVRREGV